MSEDAKKSAYPWLKERVWHPASAHHLRLRGSENWMVAKEERVMNLFWKPIPDMISALSKRSDDKRSDDGRNGTKVLDVGCGETPFPSATHLVDWSPAGTHPGAEVFRLDVDSDTFPFENGEFDFVYSRHLLEDIQNPQHAFEEMVRVGQRGHFETPSPLIELLPGVDARTDLVYRGFIHHRYIVWSELADNSLHFLPKYPIVEHMTMPEKMMQELTYLANHYPVYWNNYYAWNKAPKGGDAPQEPTNHAESGKVPKVVVHRNGFDFSFKDHSYAAMLNRAVRASLEYTDAFVTAGL